MEQKISYLIMGLGLFAGMLLGAGYSGGGVAAAVAGAAGAWLSYAGRFRQDRC